MTDDLFVSLPREESPFKVKAYRRGAESIRSLSERIDALARPEADLTRYAGIG